MPSPLQSINDYLDTYDTLFDLTDPVFNRAVEGGYIDQRRAAALGAWLNKHPLITAIYPYMQLRHALVIACAKDGWNSDTEKTLLLFINDVCLRRSDYTIVSPLLTLPEPLFGDMYAAIFDQPYGPVDLTGQHIEVTGPCVCGSHNQMYAKAQQAGGKPPKGTFRHGYLFVARSHIDARILSSKISSAVFMRMKYGQIKIFAEKHFPLP